MPRRKGSLEPGESLQKHEEMLVGIHVTLGDGN